MRKLVWLTVGFVAACFVGVYITAGSWLLLLALFSLIGCVPLFLLKTKYSPVAAVALMGCLVGFLWLWSYHQIYLNTAKVYDGKTISANIIISDYSYETDYGYAADGKIKLDGKTYQIRIYLIGEGSLEPGDQVHGDVRLRMTVEGSKQSATHHQGEGIFLLGYMDDQATITATETLSMSQRPAVWRKTVLNRIDKLFTGQVAAFSKALLLGEHHDLSYEQDSAFKISGIRHVVAVSGLHVSILFSLIYLFSGRRRYLTALLGIPALIVFAAIAGFTPSVVRACMMQGLIMIALLTNREYDPPTALATAILAMLLQNPITITSVSFQLSVCCMIGIFTFSGKIHDYLLRGKRKEQVKGKSVKARVLRWVVISISITLSATIITAPLSAYYFGSISLIGVITNILTLPLISVLFYGIMVACLVSVVSLPIAGIIARIISWPIRYVLWISRILAKFPLAAVYTSSVYIVIWLVFAYLIFAFFAISKKKRIKLTLGFVIASLLLAVGASHLEPRLDNYRVTVFDVGQGQCILLQSKNEHYLVDCGGDSGTNTADQVAQLLRSQGVTRLDGIFLTHYDKDHASGVLPLLSQISVKTLYLPDIEDTGIIRNKLTAQYEDKIQWVNQTMKIAGNCFTVSLYPAQEREDNNENCLCLLFQAEKCDILITGDRTITGEKALLEETTLPKLELLVVGHHGSGYSTGMDLLEATEPTSAVISVGEGNTFGHPADQVLTRLKLFNTKLYRTDLHGTIVFRG